MHQFLRVSLKLSLVVAIIVGTISCADKKPKAETETDNPSPQTDPIVFDKLAGTWQSADGKSFERWTKNADGSFETRGYSLKGNDTSWNEQGRVYRNGDTWIFENTVKDQNAGKAVKFVSAEVNASSVHFSNPEHDFPTDIHYNLADATTLNAFIVGPNSTGGKDTIPFPFKKIL